MTIAGLLKALKDKAKADPEVWATMADSLEALYQERHTGPVTFHFADGVAKAFELPKSDRVRLI